MGRCARNRLRNGFRGWAKENKKHIAHEWKHSKLSRKEKIIFEIIYWILAFFAIIWFIS